LGGFARTPHAAILELEREGLCRLIATCDPQPEAFLADQQRWAFPSRRVAVYTDYKALLAAQAAALDLVTLPVPIPLHAEMHAACVEAGVAVYLEKPPTLDPEEFQHMRTIERRARLATAIGFHMIAESVRQDLKARIACGEFGRLSRLTFIGLWPRSSAYYRRNDWAGRLLVNGRLVLDSCFGNAMAHYLNNLCFWAGEETTRAWRPVEWLEAELYRAHPIEGADTVFARGRFLRGAEFRLAATHACRGRHEQLERIECERATIEYRSPHDILIRYTDGGEERLAAPPQNLWKASLRQDIEFVAGRAAAPYQRLDEAEAFVAFHTLIYQAAGRIHTVPPPQLEVVRESNGETWVAIEQIAEAADVLLREGRLPSEQAFTWARPGGRATATNPPWAFRALIEAIAAARQSEGGFKAY